MLIEALQVGKAILYLQYVSVLVWVNNYYPFNVEKWTCH